MVRPRHGHRNSEGATSLPGASLETLVVLIWSSQRVLERDLWLHIESSSGLYTSSEMLNLSSSDNLVLRTWRPALGAPRCIADASEWWVETNLNLVVQRCVIWVHTIHSPVGEHWTFIERDSPWRVRDRETEGCH